MNPTTLTPLDSKPFLNTFACEYQKSYSINLKQLLGSPIKKSIDSQRKKE